MAWTAAERMGWLRACVGAVLIAAPERVLRLSGREQPTGVSTLLLRTVGIRDLVLGAGTVTAARASDAREVRRWTTTALASDSLDVLVSLVSMRSIGRRDSVAAALVAALVVVGDVRGLRRVVVDPALASP